MKGIEIRDFCGDYALDIPMGEGCVHTIYFNSRRNAEMVKRIMEVDDSVPNASTVCDLVEVVRCKDCKWWEARTYGGCIGKCENPLNGLVSEYLDDEDFCSYGERKEQT